MKKENVEMNYGEVLSRAWQIVWKHKVLWIFGILAGCTNAGGGSSNLSYSFSQSDVSPQMQMYLNQLERIPEWQWIAIVVIAFLVIFVLAVLVIFLSTVGRIGIIRGTQKADQGEARLSFGELFNGSLPYFWRVFLMNLLVGLVVAVIIFLLVILGIIGAVVTVGIALLCLLPLLCLIIPISWLLYVVVEQANIAIVVENKGILDGLQRGWEVFRTNLGAMIVMGLILIIGVGLIGGMIVGIPLFLIVIPAMSGAIIGTQTAIGGGLLIAGLCFVAYLPFLLAFSGILTSYMESAWTLTFMRLTAPEKTLDIVAETAIE
jgi:hypothetical protein